MASVAQSVERWSREPGSRVQFPAGSLGVAFLATGPGLGLKMYIFVTLEFTLLKKIYLQKDTVVFQSHYR